MKNFSINISILKRPGPKEPLIIRNYVVLFFILMIVTANFRQFSPSLFEELGYITSSLIRNPGFSYDDKMRLKVGNEYYEWTKLIREHTTQDSLVFHPPQMWPWGESGNPEFSQYFLFPAKLIREDRERLFTKRDIDFVAIAWGEGGNPDSRLLGWPKFPVFAQKTYFLPQNRVTEIKGIEGLQEGKRDAERVLNLRDGNKWDITYTASGYDYWTKPFDLVLDPSFNFKIEVKSNRLNSTALIAKVNFGNGKEAIFSSLPNQEVDEWTTLELNDLNSRAVQLATLQGWQTSELKVSEVGIDTGHPALMPYQEEWGLIEVETGTNERTEALSKGLVNGQNALSLGNVYQLNGDFLKALAFYGRAALLEPSNPWAHLGVADSAFKLGEKELAINHYLMAIENASEEAWFYYALGKAYQDSGDLSRAEEFYAEALGFYPDAVWALRGLGEIYEETGKLDLAAGNYRLASVSPRRDFTSDGKVAWQRLKKIEEDQKKIVRESLEKLNKNPDDPIERARLSSAYLVLGETSEAGDQYKLIQDRGFSLVDGGMDFPPKWTDFLAQPIYGKRGQAVDTKIIDRKHMILLDNYHSYFTFQPEIFPSQNGTVEIKWQLPPVDNSGGISSPMNILYQFNGLIFWLVENRFQLAIFDPEEQTWQVIKSEKLQLDNNKWYLLSVSYGDKGSRIYMDRKEIARGDYQGGINGRRNIYLGRGLLWSVVDFPTPSGYFDTIAVYDYQKD